MKHVPLIWHKLVILMLLTALGGLPYHWIQKIDFTKVFTMPLIMVDHLIPINLHSVYIYHSWLLLPLLVVMLIPTWALLKRYSTAIFAVNAVSFLVFMCFPTEVPRPIDLTDAPRLYQLTVLVDEPTNACPSLHASVTTLCGCFMFVLLGRFRWNPLWRAMVIVWALGILWSTLATGQHVCIDIVAGTLLGALASGLALRDPRAPLWDWPDQSLEPTL